MAKVVLIYKRKGKAKQEVELSDYHQLGSFVQMNQPLEVIAVRVES